MSCLQPCSLRVDGYPSIEDLSIKDLSIKGWAWRVPIEKPESWKHAGAPPSYEDAVLES